MREALDIIIAVLGTYGIVTLLSSYDGPDEVFRKARKDNKVFECGECLTPYVAIIPTLFLPLGFFEYLAVVGLTIIISRNT